jgi:acetyltransferase-like isoleucine patch superfamily enzyme
VQVRERAQVGRNCIIGKAVYVDVDVTIGDNVKIQNACHVYQGVTLENGVFLGPGVILTNDRYPRAINPDGSLKAYADWRIGKILVKEGAAVGARSVVLPGVTVGIFAMIGAGSVVTRDVPDYGVVWGNPARLQGFACPCGQRLRGRCQPCEGKEVVRMVCPACGREVQIAIESYRRLGEGQ